MTTQPLPDVVWFETQSRRTLDRLLPRLEERYRAKRGRMTADQWRTFTQRLDAHFPRLFKLLYRVYGQQYDFFYYLEELLNVAARMWLARSDELKALDGAREQNPQWFQSNQMLGGVCYVDLFAGDLNGLRSKIPYFKELGLTYLHLMPLFRCPEGNNDGGYAVSSYREVDPKLGTIDQLRDLASELRANGISLVLDFVFNHTSDEHTWAVQARSGDREFQDYYRMFPDRTMPDAYERNLREIFPDEHPGAFTYFPDIERWVWTTFHTFQWDLNYANPAVFNAMAEEMLALANVGVEVLRLDAVAFIWKQLGTGCENLPEAHILIQAFNAVARIAAPAMLFKSEAIVHPDEVVKYIGPDECQLSYNPLLMALLWNSLATREVRLLSHSLRSRFKIPTGCAWVNYVRCHDDIGWTFSDEDAAVLGVNGYDHRQFLNAFYTGRFEGTFARGLPFQENPKTGDCRISGTCASLAGLEKALNEETEVEVELALRRILLIHGVILTDRRHPPALSRRRDRPAQRLQLLRRSRQSRRQPLGASTLHEVGQSRSARRCDHDRGSVVSTPAQVDRSAPTVPRIGRWRHGSDRDRQRSRLWLCALAWRRTRGRADQLHRAAAEPSRRITCASMASRRTASIW